jgi:hypothetical protein
MAVDEEAQRARELVVVAEIVYPVIVVKGVAQLRSKLFPVGIGYSQRGGADFGQAADEPPPIGREVRRKEDDVQLSAG